MFWRRLFLVAILWLPMCAAPAAAPGKPVVLVFGDSLSAGLGIDVRQGWVALLQKRLRDAAYPHEVINASVSGETTAGGLSRLPATLDQHHPQIVLIELGGNDGLRGLPVKLMRENLVAMAKLAQKAGARPLIFEMRIPPNYGPAYTDAYQQAFHDAAAAVKAPLVPFFLASIVDQPGMFQDDGIHPTAAAQPGLVDAVWPTLKTLLH